jgi:hypothetical protein
LAKHDDGEIEIGVTVHGCLEALGSGVVDPPTPPPIGKIPSETIGIAAAIVQVNGGPGGFQHICTWDRRMVEKHRPPREIVNREIERPVCSSVEGRGDPLLILQLVPEEPISGATVGDEVSLGDDPNAAHAERLKDQLSQDLKTPSDSHLVILSFRFSLRFSASMRMGAAVNCFPIEPD